MTSRDKFDSSMTELMELTKQTYLPALREASKNLVPFSDLVKTDSAKTAECVELDVLHGTGLCFGLFKAKDAAIARVFLSAGSIMTKHFHGEREIFGVISGQLLIKQETEEVFIGQYQAWDVPPEIPHTIVATEDTWLWVVTMPAAEEFPNAA